LHSLLPRLLQRFVVNFFDFSNPFYIYNNYEKYFVCIYYTQSINLVADLHETDKALQALDDKMEAKVDNLLYTDSGVLFLVVFLFFLVMKRL